MPDAHAIERDVTCPVCRRFVGKVVCQHSGSVQVWTHCPRCRKWRWCDVAAEAVKAI